MTPPTPPRAARLRRALVAAAALASLAGCSKNDATPAPAASAPAPSASAAAPAPSTLPAKLTAPAQVADPNPLHLPPRKVSLDPGRRVFTFSDRMLAGAKPGSTLVLYAATVTAFDGDDLVVEGGASGSYRVHAAYVIPVPDKPKIRLREPILTEWNGTMKHAVITKLAKDRIFVRYTDMGRRTGDTMLPKNPRIVRQVDGLVPGNYAALEDGEEWKQVLLVSPLEGATKQWFCLGYGGAAMVVDEASLRPIPVKLTLRAGAEVLAEWVGTLRKATVESVDDPGLFTVKFERAGRPATVGWGAILKPL